MTLVMFDIDGTLTQSDEADERCFVQALGDVFSFTEINTDWASYPHCSDSAILHELFQTRRRRSPEAAEVMALQSHFVALLTRITDIQPFIPVPGALAFVETLQRDPAFALSLASGAWECSGRLKLTSAGLPLAHLPAAFADDAHAREAIMESSLKRAALAACRDSFDAVVYIGDGVWDARATRNLGYHFIGIAHEPTKIARLHAEGAEHVFPGFRDTEAILTLLHNRHSLSFP